MELLKGHQKGVEQKGVFEHKTPNVECVCVQIHLKHQNGVSNASKVYLCSHILGKSNPHEIYSAKKRA